jgi:TIR domain
MVYSHDVFISYRREQFQNAWMIEHFLPRLRAHLANEIAAECNSQLGSIFFDQTGVDAKIQTGLAGANGIEPGENWKNALRSAIRLSKCMIGLWSPTYFMSPWCNIEWRSFEARRPKAKVPIVIPISVFNAKRLPPEAQEYQVIEMDDYVIDGPSLRESRIFVDFNKALKLVAANVAQAVCHAPAFEDWKVIEPPPNEPPSNEPPSGRPAPNEPPPSRAPVVAGF